jgi:hypothetical protein
MEQKDRLTFTDSLVVNGDMIEFALHFVNSSSFLVGQG